MDNLILSQKIYDFLLYVYPVVAKFPKYEKFTLQTQIKNCVIDIARQVNKANNSTTKKSHLYEADALLKELKMLIRLSKDLRYINPHQYEVVSCKATEIGALLGGLIKFVQGDGGRGKQGGQ
jgi:four helix bundle protein